MGQDDYIMGQQVGKGAFGTAHIVTHKVDGLRYVLKRVRLARQSHRERQASLQELCLLSSLNHRNILQHKESWVEAGCVICMVVELCSSADLMAQLQLRITAAVYFNEEHLHDMVVQLASAFHMLHVNRIAHRDVKSSNILITGDGCLKLADFGLSILLDSSDSLTDTVVGTPSYMGPELMQEKPYGVKNDMWGLGCVLYELAALKPAFQAFNMSGLVRKITTGPTPMVPSRYSPELKALIRALLCKEAEGRPSAAQVLELPWLQSASARVEAKFGPALLAGHPIELPCISPLPADIAKLEADFVVQERAAVMLATETKSKRLAAQVKFGPKMGPQPPPAPITSQAPSPSPSPSPTPHIRQATRPGIHPPTRRSSTNNTVTATTANAPKEEPASAASETSPRLRAPDRACPVSQRTGVAGPLESHPLASSAQQARKSTSAPPTLLCTPELHATPTIIALPHRPVVLSPIPRPSPSTPAPGLALAGVKHSGGPDPSAGLGSGSSRPGLEAYSPTQLAVVPISPPPLTKNKPSPIATDLPPSRSESPSPSPSPSANYTTLLLSFPPTPSPLADFTRAAHPFYRCRNEPVNIQPLTSPTCISHLRSPAQTPQTQPRPLRVHALSPQERTASHYSLLLPPSPSSASPTPNPSPSPMRLFTPRHSTLLLTHTLDMSPLTLGNDFGSCFGSVIGSGLTSGPTNSSRLSLPRPTSAPPDSPSSTSRSAQSVPWDSSSRAAPSMHTTATATATRGNSGSSTRLRPLHISTQLQPSDGRSSTVCSPNAIQQCQQQLQLQNQHHRRSGGSSYTELISGGSSGRAGLFRSRSSSLSSMVSSLSQLCSPPRGGAGPPPVAAVVAVSTLPLLRLSGLEEEEAGLSVERTRMTSPLGIPQEQETAVFATAGLHAHAGTAGGCSVTVATGSVSPSYAYSGSSGYSTEAEAAALAASQWLKLLQQQQHTPRGRAHNVNSGPSTSPYGSGERAGRGRVGSSSAQRASTLNVIQSFRSPVHTSVPSTAALAPQNGHGIAVPRAIYSRLVSNGRTSLTPLPRAASKSSTAAASAAVSAAVAVGNADVYKYVTDPEGQPHIGNGIQPFVRSQV